MVDHPEPAVEDHQGDGDTAQGLHDRARHGANARRFEDQLKHPFGDGAHPVLFIFLHAVGLDHAGALKGLLQQRGELSHLFLGVDGHLAHAPAQLDDG